jgi:hypothetical protein
MLRLASLHAVLLAAPAWAQTALLPSVEDLSLETVERLEAERNAQLAAGDCKAALKTLPIYAGVSGALFNVMLVGLEPHFAM